MAGVGPLTFGTTYAEVAAALGRVAAPLEPAEWHFESVGVTTYYLDGRLFCVGIDAVNGPAVIYEGLSLTGRVVSEAEAALLAWTEVRDVAIRFTVAGELHIGELGLILRTQRAGDAALTRPVLVARADIDAWDYVPGDEWRRF